MGPFFDRMYGRFAAGPVSVRREADAQADCAHEKDPQTRAFLRAADGIRTLDLLHGKQNVGDGLGPELACKQVPSLLTRDAPECRDFTPIHGSLRTD
jgi:hypothetical protein